MNSEQLGEQYANDIFVGSAKKGTLFHFDLNSDRDSLDLSGDLGDLLYSKKEDSSSIVFGENFGVITDLKLARMVICTWYQLHEELMKELFTE